MEKIVILNNQLAMLSFVTWLLLCLLNDMLVIFTFFGMFNYTWFYVAKEDSMCYLLFFLINKLFKIHHDMIKHRSF